MAFAETETAPETSSHAMCAETYPGREQIDRLRQARDRVRRVAVHAGLPPHRVFDLTLAASEACANGMEHGGGTDCVGVRVSRSRGEVYVEVSSPRRFQIRAAERPFPYERGLGLPLMVTLVDEVCFARLPGGGTRVRLAMAA
jgi:anti-sigma regulatory factor (Ser/Thr protein kinase)